MYKRNGRKRFAGKPEGKRPLENETLMGS